MLQSSPWPPVWLSMMIEICIRGPGIIPRSTASLMPRSAPPASRTLVMPVASVFLRFAAALKNCRLNGVSMISMKFGVSITTCTWQSKKPGDTNPPEQSTDSSPSRPGPTSTMRPSSTTTSPSVGAAVVPSYTKPPVKRVRVMRREASRIAGAGVGRHGRSP